MQTAVEFGPTPLSSEPGLFGAFQLGCTDAFGGFQFILGRQFRTNLIDHVHAHYVIGIVDAGAVAVTVRGERHVATPGCVLVLRPFEPHTEIGLPSEGWSFRYLYPTEAVVRRAMAIHPDHPDAALPFVTPVIADLALHRAIADTHLDLSFQKPPATTEPRLAALFAHLRQRHCVLGEVARRDQLTRLRIEQARRFIIESAPRRVRVPDLARAAGLSEFHFNRVFREEVGLSAYAFFDRVRIARAHELLFLGYSPSQVAHLLEYADQPHFTRHFVRASCVAPRQVSRLRDRLGTWVQAVGPLRVAASRFR